MKHTAIVAALALILFPGVTAVTAGEVGIQGKYVETRSCDVFTAACFANGEVGITGTEAILTWSIDQGAWNGVELDGLNVIAVVRANNTLGNPYQTALPAKCVLIVDSDASEAQRESLADLAGSLGGELTADVVEVKFAPITASIGECKASGCARVEAEGLVEIATRCLGGDDHICGNESTFYPPLTKVDDAMPAYTDVASYKGDGLGITFRNLDRRSAFLATFSHS
jgi:hypothetical protein